MQKTAVIVIGASAGGIPALKKLVSLLPEDLPGALFIVQHLPANHATRLHHILSASGPLPAVLARDKERYRAGVIYVSQPNQHLLVKDGYIATAFGPRENRARPSINVLFRSAAAYHTNRVTAVLLSGYRNDGVSGLDAVKRCGGLVIVQDPAESEADELPQSAISHVQVDHVLPVAGIAALLPQVIDRTVPEPPAVAEDIMEEVWVSEHEIPDIRHMRDIGELLPYTCPECGGSLWKAGDEPLTRYVCHTGHSFSQAAFLESQAEVIENSLWTTMRYVQERTDILQKMIDIHHEKGQQHHAATLERKVAEMKHHLLVLRKFIMSDALKELTENIENVRSEG